MNRIITAVIIGSSLLFAVSGEEVFKKKCASCHEPYIPQSKLNENYEHNNTLLRLKAPTLTELSFRLKDQVGDRMIDAEGQKFQIEEWLAQFLKDPTAQTKSILPKRVRAVYGTMPSITVNEDEIEALADYMYEYAEKMMIAHGVKRYSYEDALKKAKTEGKIVLIEGYLPYCRHCIRMDRNVMVEPMVKEVLDKDFVLVKMNLLIEKLPLGMKRLGTPSFYFIDPRDPKVIDMFEGEGTVDEFIDLLKSIKDRL